MSSFFEFSEEVADALAQKKPLLALESTLITHGFHYPDNVEIALRAEAIAREHHVVPVTIAIMDGKIKYGLSPNELEKLASKKTVIKASRRDLAYTIAEKYTAGTTVAATLYCANQVGIKVFATGGIGGVHRGDALDISADLIELSRTPLAVVCAGAKSILDLPKTLEFLETFSIPVIGYQTKQLPSFYSATSLHGLPLSVDTVSALANIIRTHWQLQEKSSILITNPIPRENEIATEVIEPIIESALIKAAEQNIKGKNITPFLLNEVATLTQQKSCTANKKLIENNVALGAQLAYAIAS
jgi:pseudouridylate synthase